jgi:hypothetical protein
MGSAANSEAPIVETPGLGGAIGILSKHVAIVILSVDCVGEDHCFSGPNSNNNKQRGGEISKANCQASTAH